MKSVCQKPMNPSSSELRRHNLVKPPPVGVLKMSTTTTKTSTTSSFEEFEATKKLRVLAQQPFDLTTSGNLTAERITKSTTEGAGWRYNYGCQRIDENVLTALEELAIEAGLLDKMKAMQSGEVMNFYNGYDSENRAVLHTAMRDFFDSPNTGKEASAATELARTELNKLKAWGEELDNSGQYTDIVFVGIGGSNLGPRTTFHALEAYKRPDRNVHFVSNVDPDDATWSLRNLDPRKTVVVVVSKSGGTLETATNEEFFRKWYESEGVDPSNHFVAVTGKGSPMDNPSNYWRSFYIWDYVGGRFSTTSTVGGTLLTFAFGFDVWWDFLRGCSAMDKHALTPSVRNNIPLLNALIGIWNHNFLNLPTCAIVPYSKVLWRFSAHIQQVDMESNGKCVNSSGQPLTSPSGPIVWGEPGTDAQHSFFQLIHQSTDVVPVEFIGCKSSQFDNDIEYKGTTSQEKLLANMFAQSIALATGQQDENPAKVFPGNRPSSTFLTEKITPYTFGALFACYEHKVAFQGWTWGINSFDQEGVQLGKVLATRILEFVTAERNGTDGTTDTFPLGEAFWAQLKTL